MIAMPCKLLDVDHGLAAPTAWLGVLLWAVQRGPSMVWRVHSTHTTRSPSR